jgi:hypothetical protein
LSGKYLSMRRLNLFSQRVQEETYI